MPIKEDKFGQQTLMQEKIWMEIMTIHSLKKLENKI